MADLHVTDEVEVTAHTGDTVTVRVQELQSSGFSWAVTGVGRGLDLEESRSVPPSSPAAGASGDYLVRVRAREPGTWHIDLRQARAWQPELPEERRVTVNVD